MTDKDHRLGVTEANLVVRHLKLEDVDSASIKIAIQEIDRLYGLDSVSFDKKSNVINFAYDATRVSIEGIEEILDKYEIEISHGWWTHFKESYYRFTDENIKDNANDEPWSCHKNIPRK
jgi:hypothetical protein